MVKHYHSLEDLSLKKTWLTIGVFDGVHRGHQEILSKLMAGAHTSGAPAVVLTFYPHPTEVLGKQNNLKYLTLPDEKVARLGELGVDIVVTHPFNTEVAFLSAWEFMQYLKVHLDMRQLWVGYDFALGRNRGGDVFNLTQIGNELGYHVHPVAPVVVNDKVVSSSQIRSLLFAGRVSEASAQLGRPYALSGRVVHGDGRGRKINIPTANLDIPTQKAIPANGVYACQAWVGEGRYPAVTNIGIRPTFTPEMKTSSVETHILDLTQDLYDQVVKLEFIKRLREERKFPSTETLVEQIQVDISRAREVLNGAQD